MAGQDLISAADLRERFRYEPDVGFFFKKNYSARSTRREPLGCINPRGYRSIMISGKRYLAHRLAWFYTYGEWPRGAIDHINGDPLDNRIGNLRDVPLSHNAQNQTRPHSNNSTGHLGVRLDKRNGVFRAFIRCGGREISLGAFATPEDASRAYISAKRAMHPGGLL